MSSKPVWVWLPGSAAPVRAGDLAITGKVGSFSYDPTYRALVNALPLDPHNLPFTRSQRPLRETRQNGLFGVFLDASPEGFGLGLLEHTSGRNLADPLDRLEASVGDGVGALEVCDDIERKLQWKTPQSTDLVQALSALKPEESPTRAAREVMKVDGTSLGGERPKLTVLHQGQLWIAKLQLRGDPPHAPLREYAAMQSARAAGLDVAETQFLTVGSRQLLLVRRFDRHITPDGALNRRLFASAHTVLGLDGSETRGDRNRSYVALALELRRWCGRAGETVVAQQRELFRRMAFNAICGNGDDHPRNHGLIHADHGWHLASAFDIAPYVTFSRTLAMAVNKAGLSEARADLLLADCESFGYARQDALDFIQQAIEVTQQAWPQAVASGGVDPKEVPTVDPAWLDVAGVSVQASRAARQRVR